MIRFPRNTSILLSVGFFWTTLGGGVSGFATTNFYRPAQYQQDRTISTFSPLCMASSSNQNAPTAKDPSFIRNVAIIGHSHSGKTSLVEWMLYDEQVITQKPSSGESSILDSDPFEAARHSSIFSHFARIPHRGHLLEVADTPWGDFPSDAYAALDGADAAVIVVSAADGVQSGTINAYQHCTANGIKPIIALSKMDRPFLQINDVLQELEDSLGVKPTPLQIALGDGKDFKGIKSLLAMDQEGNVAKYDDDNDDDAELKGAWEELVEAVAMSDDDLLVEYLENADLEPPHIIGGLRSGVLQGKILPLVYTSSEQDLGVTEMMDAIVAALPNPIESREEALRTVCLHNEGKCGMEPGVEAGFAARVLHTTVDSFGSLSILRVVSNSRDGDGVDSLFDSLPQEAVVLRTGETIKMPSASASFGLCGKARMSLADKHVLPGDVIAVPKLPEGVRTNDILSVPTAVQEEEAEIDIEMSANVLTPLSRPIEEVSLMAAATLSLPETGGRKGKGGKGGKAGGDSDKLVNCLTALAREDLAMQIEHDPSGKLLVRCMSGDHLQLVAERLKNRYGVEVELGNPPVQYRETLVKAVHKVEGKHKKQSGGSGQFGVCFISMEPLEEGAGIEFESQIKGGAISKPFISSVEKGVLEELASGGPMGFPVTDVRVIVTDGKMHSVDSKDIAFQSAGKQAVKEALRRGKTRLLQPMEKVTFMVDEKIQGEVNSIVARQSGYVTNAMQSNSQPDHSKIEAILPTACIPEVSEVLRAESAGEGQYTSVFSHYQPVPENLVEEIVSTSTP